MRKPISALRQDLRLWKAFVFVHLQFVACEYLLLKKCFHTNLLKNPLLPFFFLVAARCIETAGCLCLVNIVFKRSVITSTKKYREHQTFGILCVKPFKDALTLFSKWSNTDDFVCTETSCTKSHKPHQPLDWCFASYLLNWPRIPQNLYHFRKGILRGSQI